MTTGGGADTAAQAHSGPPAVDRDTLRRLHRELNQDCTALSCFVGSYLEMLEDRIARIESALAERDLEALTVATLSLRTTSTMVGALSVASAVGDLETAHGHGGEHELGSHLERIRLHASEAGHTLRSMLEARSIGED